MNQYYYFVASLPLLKYDALEAVLTPQDFLRLAQRQLSTEDYNLLKQCRWDNIVSDEDTLKSVFGAWQKYEISLRNELVRIRAQEKGVEARPYLVPGERFTSSAFLVKEAIARENPLATEKALWYARWKYLDFLVLGHFFDLDVLVIYYLKLQVLAVLRSFNRDQGLLLLNAIKQEKINEILGGENSYE